MDIPSHLKDAPLLIQADWHEERGDSERARELRRIYARQNPDPNEGWSALLTCLANFANARDDQWVAVREKDSGEQPGISFVMEDGAIVVEIIQAAFEGAWVIPSGMLGVLYRYGVVTSVEEMCTNSGDVDYWTAYRVNCASDSRQGAAVVRDLLREYKPELGLEDYRFAIEPE